MRLVLMLLLYPFLLCAQSGPGGPGTTDASSNLILWLKADAGTDITSTAINGIKLNQWVDHSGFNILGISPEPNKRPTFLFNSVNECYPSIYFDGKDDYFQLVKSENDDEDEDEDEDDEDSTNPFNVQDDFVIFFVAKADVIHDIDSQSNIDGDIQGIDYQKYILGPTYASGGKAGLGISLGTNGISAYEYGQNYFPSVNTVVNNPPDFYIGNDYHIYSLTVKNNRSTFCIDGDFIDAGLASGKNHVKVPTEVGGAMSNALQSMDNYFEGNLTELIIFKDGVNQMEQLAIQNYLSAKYDIDLKAGDLYTMDEPDMGNFDHHVAGIGLSDNGDLLLESKGSGIVCISSASDLDINEFLFWGSNSKGNFTDLAPETPVGTASMMATSWAVSEIGESGKLNVCLNYSIFENINPKEIRLVIDTNGDGSFLDEVIPETLPFESVEINAETSEITFKRKNLNDGDKFTFASRSPFVPLPIELANFSAKVISNQQVQLFWTTKTESNNSHFIIERSTDNRHFFSIGMEAGQGNSQTAHDYTFTDTQPNHGENYYRLKQVDLDGGFSYSNIVRANIKGTNTDIYLYPNPVRNELTIELPEIAKGNLTIQIYNTVGKLVQEETLEQDNYTNANLKINLNPGAYFLRVRSKNYEHCKPFVVSSTK